MYGLCAMFFSASIISIKLPPINYCQEISWGGGGKKLLHLLHCFSVCLEKGSAGNNPQQL